MAVATTAKRVIGGVVRWERRAVGVTDAIPAGLRRRMRAALGMAPLRETRLYAANGGLEELFRTLDQRNVRYVVLRWFEGLPACVDGDIDFLMGDEAIPHFEQLLGSDTGGVPCDLYSETGVPGYRYAQLPYLPPALARQILSRRVTVGRRVSVPCPEDHFLSLAYHAIYQKGLQSGLPTCVPSLQPAREPMHDYRGTLTHLSEALRLPVEIGMEALDAYLSSQGWRPAMPVLKRLARDNIWLRERLRLIGAADRAGGGAGN